MTRGLLFGLLMGTLVAVVVLAIVALKIERDRNHMFIVETPPVVVEHLGPGAPLRLTTPVPLGLSSLPVGRAGHGPMAAVPAPQALPHVVPPVSVDRLLRAAVPPQAPQLDLTAPLAQIATGGPAPPGAEDGPLDRTTIAPLTGPEPAPRVALPPMRPTDQPPMPAIAQDPATPPGSPLDQIGEALGLGQTSGQPSDPMLHRLLPPTRFVDDGPPALPHIAQPGQSAAVPQIAWNAPEGAIAPHGQVTPLLELSQGAVPTRTDLPMLAEPMLPVWPVPAARPPSVADILRDHPRPTPATGPIAGPVMAVIWVADGAAEAETGTAIPVLTTAVERGALSGLAQDLLRHGTGGPILVTVPPAATATADLAALSQFAGVLVDGAALALLAAPGVAAVPVYPAQSVADLTRAAIHAQRDGAVIVALPDTPETRAGFADWRAEPTALPMASTGAAFARLLAR